MTRRMRCCIENQAPLVDWLFLTPDYLFYVGETAELFEQFLIWKGIELLNAHNRYIVEFLFGTGFPQIVKNLTATARHALPFR